MTALLANGLVDRGHDVTLFAVGGSRTRARLQATFERGYASDPAMWPWESCELFHLAAAVRQARAFDVIHHQAEYAPIGIAYAGVSATPVLQTVHHSPDASEVRVWQTSPGAPIVALSRAQAALLQGLDVVAIVPHAVDLPAFAFRPEPDGDLLFLGRFTEGKGVLQAIEIARRAGRRLVLAAAENDYYRAAIAPLVDGSHVRYAGEVDHAAKVDLLNRAGALLYPVQAAEPFGLVLAEAAACGCPVAALDGGAVPEIVAPGISGGVFSSLDALVEGLPSVLALDRQRVRAHAMEHFGIDRMVDGYERVYRALATRQNDADRPLP